MLLINALFFHSLLAVVYAQQAGTHLPEIHPKIRIKKCSSSGSCTDEQRSVVLDSNWRWVHKVGGFVDCFTGQSWDSSLCPDPITCSKNCAIEGVDYAYETGVTTSGDALTLKYLPYTSYPLKEGARVFLMQDEDNYQLFKLKNQEFTFDVDLSTLPCGLNGALYFVGMEKDGGKTKYPTNNAGAKFGTGYCDSKCSRQPKFIDGEANVLDWTPSEIDPHSGIGRYGACCDELDIWEANSVSTALTAHPCKDGFNQRCEGEECNSGICDQDGCEFNPFRLGNKGFFGPNGTVNTSQKITVVTQFITSDGSDTGELSEIRRVYVQAGKVIGNSKVQVPEVEQHDSVSNQYCSEIKSTFGEGQAFSTNGGLKTLGNSLDTGMVLTMSISGDYSSRMLWLDSNHPAEADPSTPGVARGTCDTASGDPFTLRKTAQSASVTYSNIKYGPLGSTFTSL